MTYYPVIIPTLNRYEHFKQCIESLKKCIYADKTELVIGLDYPPSEKYIDGYNKIKSYISNISGFGKLTLFEHEHNFGAKDNAHFLKNYVLKKYDCYIYSEDDNIFSPFFLIFMDEALEKYKKNEKIFAINGYSYPCKWYSKKSCMLENRYFSAWGYGAFKEKEEAFSEYLCPENLYKEMFKKEGCYKKWKSSTLNFYQMIGQIFQKNIPVMDITISGYMYAENKYVLMPTKTLVTNMGWDGSGEHCAETNGKVDFRNLNRNNSSKVDINDSEELSSKDIKLLENTVKCLISKKQVFRTKLLYLFIKIFGFENSRRIRCSIKYGKI